MPAPSWTDEERGLSIGLRQAARLLELGLRRPFKTLLASVCFTALTLGVVILLRPAYEPRYLLRVVENDRDPGTTPRPRRQLREYVLGAAFTSEPLFGIINKHGLYPGLMRKNPRAALESFREDIDVDVYRNYFVEQRTDKEPPRSARVAVRYKAKDPDLALAVTRDLGNLIVEHERKVRHDQAVRLADEAGRTLNGLSRTLEERRRSVVQAQRAIAQGSEIDTERAVELVSLSGSLEPLELSVAEAQRRKASLDLGAAYEKGGAGMFFEVVDDGALPESTRIRTRKYVGIAIIAFGFGFPLVALAVGAFSSKRGLV
jgi:hypothetical protein